MKIQYFLTIAAIFAGVTSTNAQTYTETVGARGSVEATYADVRGWRVFSGQINGKFSYCVAEKATQDSKVRLGYNDGQWQLSVPVAERNDWQGQLEVDRRVRPISGAAVGPWTVAWLGLEDLERLKAGSEAILDIGRLSYEVPLSGSTAAVLKVQECWDNDGQKPRANNAPPPNGNGQRTAEGYNYQFPYAHHGNWTVTRFTYDKKGKNFSFCTAVLNAGQENSLQFLMNKSHFNYGFRAHGTQRIGDNVPVRMWFDNESHNAASGKAYRLDDTNGRDVWLNYSEKIEGPGAEQDFMSYRTVNALYSLDGRDTTVTFSLAGSTQAITSLFACAGH